MDAQELAAGELLLELVDAADRGLEASLVGDEPDIVAVRLREPDLGRRSRTMRSPLTPTMRGGGSAPARPLALDRCRRSARRSRASRSAGRREDGRRVIHRARC